MIGLPFEFFCGSCQKLTAWETILWKRPPMCKRLRLRSRSARKRRQTKGQRRVDAVIHREIAGFGHAQSGDVRAQRMWIIACNERDTDFELACQNAFLRL